MGLDKFEFKLFSDFKDSERQFIRRRKLSLKKDNVMTSAWYHNQLSASTCTKQISEYLYSLNADACSQGTIHTTWIKA